MKQMIEYECEWQSDNITRRPHPIKSSIELTANVGAVVGSGVGASVGYENGKEEW